MSPIIFFMSFHPYTISLYILYVNCFPLFRLFRKSNVNGFLVGHIRFLFLWLGELVHKVGNHIQNLGYGILILDIYQLGGAVLDNQHCTGSHLSAQTTDFDTAISTLDAQIAAFGGFIERSDVNGDTRYNNDGTTSIINRWAYYTIRVPASRFEEFLHQTEGIGNVTSVSRYAENVTSQYTDYEARLDSLRTQEERLLAMLEKSEDVESLIALEQRLADVRYELESIERNLRNLDLQISYSTINLNLQEVEVYTPTVPVQRTFSEKLSDAFSDGWTGFVRGLQYFCLGLASSLPGLVLFVLIVLALFFLVRSILRKVKSGRKAKQEASQQPPEQDSKSE